MAHCISSDDLAARAAEGAAMSLDQLVAYAIDIDGSPPTGHQEWDV